MLNNVYIWKTNNVGIFRIVTCKEKRIFTISYFSLCAHVTYMEQAVRKFIQHAFMTGVTRMLPSVNQEKKLAQLLKF